MSPLFSLLLSLISFELEVINIHRPVELKGRFVTATRQVFLKRLKGPEEQMKLLLGGRFTVLRERNIPGEAESQYRVNVGQLKIKEIRGKLLIAEIVYDGLKKRKRRRKSRKKRSSPEALAISLGDRVQATVEPPPKIDPKEEKRKAKERARKRAARRKKKRQRAKPYQRSKWIWDL